MFTRPTSVLVALSAAISATMSPGAARAQCDVFRDGIPDFDQLRSALPNNGTYYCVPTTSCNLLAYLAIHGSPTIFVEGGTFNDWDAQYHYDTVTYGIMQVASRMGTDANSGTQSDSIVGGLQSYIDSNIPDVFTVSSTQGHIRAIELYDKMSDGRLVMVCFGYYTPDSSGHYSRMGGHCVTLTGVANSCGGSLIAQLRLRDPADDSVLNTQSGFTSVVTNAIQEVLPTSSDPLHLLQLTSLGLGSTTLRCLDQVVSIRSTYAVWPSALQGSWTRALVAGITAPVQGGVLAQYPTGNGRPIVGSALSGDGMSLIYTTTALNPNAATPLYSQNVSDGSATLLMNLPAPSPIATDRFGDLYVCSGGQIQRFDISGAAPVLVAAVTPNAGQTPDVLAWDDASDQLLAITQATRNLLLFSRTLGLVATHPLPSGVAPEGMIYADVGHSPSAYIVGSNASNFVYDLRVNPLHPTLDVAQSFAISGVAGVRAIQIGDQGRLYVMTNAGEREFVRNATSGLWEPAGSTLFGSVPASNSMLISHGRTNYDPTLFGGPGWQNNVLVPEPTPARIRECAADANLDGAVTIADIFLFLNRWFAQSRAADFNVSGAVTVQDIFDFLSAWFTGCP